MLLGTSTSHLLKVVTSAAADIEVSGSVVVVSSASPPVVDGGATGPVLPASITTATTTTLVTGAASKITRVDELALRNNHASTSCDVTITREDGTNTDSVIKATLLAGELLVYNRAGSWLHYDSNGALYPSSGNVATQAEMEAGTAANKYVAPSVAHFAPSAAKNWGCVTVSGGTPTLQTNYNITSITDTATDRLTVTIGNDFSSVNYSIQATIEAATTTYSATTTSLVAVVRNASKAVGSFILDCLEFDIGQATDPASWSWVCFGDL